MSTSEIADLVGYAAGTCNVGTMIPQIIKSIRTQKSEDVSWGMLTAFLLAMLLWLIYALLVDSAPIKVTNSVALFLGVVQMTLKWHYDRKTC